MTPITEPCVASHIYTAYTLGIGQVSWDLAAGADRYTARAVTSEGAAVSCDTIDTNCDMQGLNCSQLYNVSVQAHNSACNDSVVSLEPEVIQTGEWTTPPPLFIIHFLCLFFSLICTYFMYFQPSIYFFLYCLLLCVC